MATRNDLEKRRASLAGSHERAAKIAKNPSKAARLRRDRGTGKVVSAAQFRRKYLAG